MSTANTTNTDSSTVSIRDRAKALLAYTLESQLTGTVTDPATAAADGPWDRWWVCYRAAAPADELHVTVRTSGGCARCHHDAAVLVQTCPPGHPDQLGPRDCDCLHAWAVRMRRPAPELDWPRLRVSVAMLKPEADWAAARHLLCGPYIVLHTIERHLTTTDTRRLYPDAYGVDYVARCDAYLTSGPVEVLILLAATATANDPQRLKAEIRRELGDTDPLRNHLHMPDNPGDALCDLRHLAGPDILGDLYERYERDAAPERLARYRAVLARR